jgi:hypothetical protein
MQADGLVESDFILAAQLMSNSMPSSHKAEISHGIEILRAMIKYNLNLMLDQQNTCMHPACRLNCLAEGASMRVVLDSYPASTQRIYRLRVS